MRLLTKTLIGAAFVGAFAIGGGVAVDKAQAQGFYGTPGFQVYIGEPPRRHYRERRYRSDRYYRGYDRGPYAYQPRRSRCPVNYTVQDGVCKPYRGY